MTWFTRIFKGDDPPLPDGAQDKNQSHSDQGAQNTTNTDPMAQETDSAVAIADEENDVQSDTSQ